MVKPQAMDVVIVPLIGLAIYLRWAGQVAHALQLTELSQRTIVHSLLNVEYSSKSTLIQGKRFGRARQNAQLCCHWVGCRTCPG